MTEEERRRKIFWLRLATAVIAVLILFIWVANLKNIWRESEDLAPAVPDSQWADFREELNQSLSDIQDSLERRSAASNPASTTPATPISDEEQLILEDILKETVEKAASSVTGTAEVRRQSCPEWINCMPTFGDSGGAPRACVVPPGCEDITQIAY